MFRVLAQTPAQLKLYQTFARRRRPYRLCGRLSSQLFCQPPCRRRQLPKFGLDEMRAPVRPFFDLRLSSVFTYFLINFFFFLFGLLTGSICVPPPRFFSSFSSFLPLSTPYRKTHSRWGPEISPTNRRPAHNMASPNSSLRRGR